MADDGEASNKPKSYNRPQQQEANYRAQETQIEPRFPNRSTGIIPLPPGSRGPRSLYLKRHGDSFGFTLRHFIVYPPDSITDSDGRHAAVGALSTPMDTIFVKHIKERGSAKLAGLQRGDRLVAVNGIPVTDKSYSQVVQLIQNSPDYLHLLVVPKEDDILQRHFSETAYNPASNQNFLNDKQSAQSFLTQTFNQLPVEFQVDAYAWNSLQNPYYDIDHRLLYSSSSSPPSSSSSSAANILNYSEIYPNEFCKNKTRAQPHTTTSQLYYNNNNNNINKKMGRRASDGCALSDRDSFYDPIEYSCINSDTNDRMVVNNSTKLKTMYKIPQTTTTTTSTSSNITTINSEASQNKKNNKTNDLRQYHNISGCRLSLDGESNRCESSSSSLRTSSLIDGSKDSLNSFDSTSTVTGHETDDSAIMNRYRRSFQQKEEFLRTPITISIQQQNNNNNNNNNNKINNKNNNIKSNELLIQREFYGRPKKLDKSKWPPNELLQQQQQQTNETQPSSLSSSSSKISTTTIKPTHQNFQRVKNDIDYERDLLQSQMTNNEQYQQLTLKNNNKLSIICTDKMNEIKRQSVDIDVEQINGSSSTTDDDCEDKRTYPQCHQIVHKRAREFESGKPLPEDDPILGNRTSFYRSELARLSSKRVVPNVTERAQEFEIRSIEPKRDTSGSSTNSLKRIQRDTRSLESTGSTASSSSVNEVLNHNNRLSGNVLISSGSKFIHCPPPSEYDKPTSEPPENQAIKVRARSNSAESWLAALHSDEEKDKRQINQQHQQTIKHNLNKVNGEDKTVVVKRRTKSTNIADDEERAMRRESYLKATEGGRMHFDPDYDEVTSQLLRSAHRRWRPPLFPGDIQQLRKLFEDAASSLGGSVSGNSSSSASLDREKQQTSSTTIPTITTTTITQSANVFEKKKYNIIKEGLLHCKITEIDGKRFGDRSWKQIWATLKGPKLYLQKDKHHQSPIGTSDSIEHSLATGVDMRASVVRVAEDYTKRKHVLRVSSVNPCRSEFLLQADNTEELADWVKALQDQMATTTDVEAKINCLKMSGSKQQAVPQTVAAVTSIEVQGSSRLSPLPAKSKSSSARNRSPTGQSPVSKTRKPSHTNEPASTSPKSKTWRGRVAKQFRKMQGATSPTSPTTPEGSTFGIPLEQCIPSLGNPFVPRFVEVCTDIVDERGLHTIGIYRVPGNNASITALTEEVNRNYNHVPVEDPRWNDLHVVSSLLKSYFRKMPDSLVTNTLYPYFIKADKIDDCQLRMKELRKLVKNLPPHNYHTLKHIILHLTRVVDHCDINKMEAKNLAIVFGPTIVRPEEENMESMVNNMTHQCKIVETLLTCADWFFSDNETNLPIPIANTDVVHHHEDSEPGKALLLDNIGKYEALKEKDKNGALFSSIISAAQRKINRKPNKGSGSLTESKEEVAPNNSGGYPLRPFSLTDLKESTSNNNNDGKINVIPTTVGDIEKMKKQQPEKVPWFNYSTDQEDFHRRIENFELETKAMLQMPRNLEISVSNKVPRPASLNSSATNVSQNSRLSAKPMDLLKTHSASNVFNRTLNLVNRNSLDNSYSVQYNTNLITTTSEMSDKNFSDYDNNILYESDNIRNIEGNSSGSISKGAFYDSDTKGLKYALRRGSSVENIHSLNTVDANGTMKKIKYENENEYNPQRSGSLDSLHKITSTDDDIDLVTSLTKLYDKKLKEKSEASLLDGNEDELQFVDEPIQINTSHSKNNDSVAIDKENIPYRNPSLHKNQYNHTFSVAATTSVTLPSLKIIKPLKESKNELEKDLDSTENFPNNNSNNTNDRYVNKLNIIQSTNKLTSNLRRSESLNKPERTASPLSIKVKRSESLNKTSSVSDRLKRSDSLTKNEKTESNLNKRRELSTSNRRSKEVKLKRKNGMPDRSIKRRHTVGGTKDPDKVTWLDNKYHEQVESNCKDNDKEKNLRTSSPDLSSTRRERLCFEINLIGPENMVMALRQHLIGARPQSFPETAVFKVPLESHV